MNGQTDPTALLVFAREPCPGQVKTRLANGIGADAAAAVYLAMLQTIVAMAADMPRMRGVLCHAEAQAGPLLTALARRHAMELRAQRGGHLGERMYRALQQALRRHHAAILIGSDCPQYQPAYLEGARAALDTHDAVLGPAQDGGYVLIGLRRPQAALFRDIPWGSPGVLAATREALQTAGLRWCELATLRDVDTAADLAGFPHLQAIAAGRMADIV